jgi:anthranilate phosphoribosyltransferase
LDEISLCGRTFVAEVENGSVRTFEMSPADLSLIAESREACRTVSAEESAALIRLILAGEHRGSTARSIVLLNAAAGAFIARSVDTLSEGLEAAVASIETGAALGKLDRLANAVRA